ncbi:MAG: hypothetical protein OEM58_12160 [Nitrospirota bacterium]|nr:hypothetical protein [Nitrospirota bacterium]
MPRLSQILREPCPEPLRLRSGQACRMDQDDKYREFILITVMPDIVNRASILAFFG